jgi:two-component system LytT family response regulator
MSEDRHSYACAEAGRFLVNRSLSELETRLDPACFLRIHRSAIVNLHFVDQISGLVRWPDPRETSRRGAH